MNVHDSLYAEASIRASEQNDLEELQKLEAEKKETQRANGGSSWEVDMKGESSTRASKREKVDYTALFERLSKPLVCHVKYEEQQKLDKEKKVEQERLAVEQQRAALDPIIRVNWRPELKRFHLSDLETQNDHYTSRR